MPNINEHFSFKKPIGKRQIANQVSRPFCAVNTQRDMHTLFLAFFDYT